MEKSGRKSWSLAAIAAAGLLVAGCGGTAAKSNEPSSLTVAVFAPFHGALAAFGPNLLAGCIAGADEVNASGGVMGRPITCERFDSGTDPADGVPAATRMVASAGNLEYVLGPGPAGPATVPIILGTHTLDLALAPDPQFDNNTNPYFYRIFPSDSVGGTAIAAWGTLRRYKTAAVVFGEGQSQTEVPNLKRSFVRHGGRITWLKPLAEGQSSYRTAIEQIAATHPEVVFSELDNQTAATFWSEWLQLVGKLPRIVEGPTGASLPWIQTMIKTVGQAALVRDVVIVNNSAPNLSGPAYKQYAKLVPTVKAVADPSQFVGDPAGAEWFDTLQYTALAMDAARTTNPRVWRSYIREVTGAPRPGVTVVRTYAQGVAALKAGKRITYRGADGAYVFDSHNNLAAAFSGYVWEPAHKTLKQLAQLPTVTPGS